MISSSQNYPWESLNHFKQLCKLKIHELSNFDLFCISGVVSLLDSPREGGMRSWFNNGAKEKILPFCHLPLKRRYELLGKCGFQLWVSNVPICFVFPVTYTIGLYSRLVIKLFKTSKILTQSSLPMCPCFWDRGKEMMLGQVGGRQRSCCPEQVCKYFHTIKTSLTETVGRMLAWEWPSVHQISHTTPNVIEGRDSRFEPRF